ncbi:hypothetical protein ABFS82_02G153700 [Erythranthe guttata]|uniref:Cytochrome P450 n=1 Tax=Erythranthe guttata TaxID=4155 RepID=A0A022QVX0_ERYGU|nr:PREDICTED: geraniol 8-hydroxylase [Erythranthe guttata]EYU32021.1 hypothetical protein MIMGU_mgv1a005095mg [Erythranthe guttata]|eukprot:XP_012843627.1 PREDICTED: geraniol 8-hydroxylase [Erythranthe guttata]
MDFPTFLLVIFSALLIYSIVQIYNYRARKWSKLPPGPFQFPIIGNILELGRNPHRSLAELSRKYGPVISLKLGRITTIVIFSPETAKIVLQKHDLEFSSRTVPSSGGALGHGGYSVAWLPVGDQWRKLRRICRERIFSASKLDLSQGLRREEVRKLRRHVAECCETGRVVDIGDAAFTTSLNLMSATLFSTEFARFGSDSSAEMKGVMRGVMRCLGEPNLADYFPVLKWADPQGITRRARVYFEKMFAIFDGIIDEKLKSRGGIERDDLLEALIEINRRDEAELSINDIKHLLLDIFLAGMDTTAATVEWAMTELLRNPRKMSKLRDEIRDIVGENKRMEESDIQRLPYLQAVVKESLRLHPPGPFLIPHKAEAAGLEINGYKIPKNAQILVNVWAIGRDSAVWPEADSFSPERFLDGQIDFKGKDFELIPFGSGRRICPGLPLACRMVPFILGTLVGDFGWEIENSMKPEDLDVNEKFGMVMQKEIPLMAVPITKL